MGLKIKYTNRSIDIDVKPCPFCGNDNLFVTDPDEYYKLCGRSGSSCISIECQKCSLDFYQHNIPKNIYDVGLGMLVTRWNHRIKED